MGFDLFSKAVNSAAEAVSSEVTLMNILIHFTPVKTYVYVADYYCFDSDDGGVEFKNSDGSVEYTVSGNYVSLLIDQKDLTKEEKIRKAIRQYGLTEDGVAVIDCCTS
ncbi:hypothetical protein [Salisediminibacterium selenitireducens]|uniref:Uncharacterized protein n=1 Tax=Bacillus selenitireducens (strain ATCC 700615 / DSM 15326 / MLS10) TaxID=439292 RepID=D6XWF3_BACIE|nr:hypothetical protein [Salisediminibacterium selenitireducens]ADH97795.1 hypothetical protein Bsel_0251 [[Bacillus] selenitireducens MLS10]